MRLDRYLSEMGVESRSKIRELCKKGQVRVNGAVQKKSDAAVNPGLDVVEALGEEIPWEPLVYILLNKPQGVITATEDAREKTVLDLIRGRKRKDLFPVGRLDKDTEGLLLITNDGELAGRLLSPKHHVPKTYYARVEGWMGEEQVELFREGLDIGDDKKTLPAELKILTAGEISEIELTITEGRYHQVKRMVQAAGCRVIFLKRISMGSLQLPEDLAPGEFRRLTEEEKEALREEAGL